MRNPRDLDDVLKTDATRGPRIDQDALDGGRYSLMSMLPHEEELREKLEAIPASNVTARHIVTLQHQAQVRRENKPIRKQRDWRTLLEGDR